MVDESVVLYQRFVGSMLSVARQAAHIGFIESLFVLIASFHFLDLPTGIIQLDGLKTVCLLVFILSSPLCML